MKTVQKLENQKIENQVQFWAMLGPFVILLITTFFLYQSSFTYTLFPLVALLGIWFYVKWQIRGLIGTCLGMGALLCLLYPFISYTDFLWLTVVSASLCLALIISVLSYDEICDLLLRWNTLSISESKSQKQSLSDSKDLLERALNEKISALNQTVASQENQINSLKLDNSKMLADLSEAHQQNNILDTDLKHLRFLVTARDVSVQQLQGELISLQEQCKSLEQLKAERKAELDALQKTLLQKQEEMRRLTEKNLDFSNQILRFKNELGASESREKQAEAIISSLHIDSEAVQKSLLQKQVEIEKFLKEKEFALARLHEIENVSVLQTHQLIELSAKLEEALNTIKGISEQQQHISEANEANEVAIKKRAEAMYKQLRIQFEEKSKILNETRRELFLTTEKVLVLQKALHEKQLHRDAFQAKIDNHIVKSAIELQKVEKQYKEEIESLHSIIGVLVS